jgi:aryl-alcohol dehydrogenase-like predicted oxidoreductase
MVLRDIEEELVPYSIANSKAIIAYSPLQRGILSGKITSDYKFKDGDHRPESSYYKEPNLSSINQILKEIKPIADIKKCNACTACHPMGIVSAGNNLCTGRSQK